MQLCVLHCFAKYMCIHLTGKGFLLKYIVGLIRLVTLFKRIWCFFCGSFLLFVFYVCHAVLSVLCSLLDSLVYGVFLCICHFPIWCPGSGVVFDCIDSWSLPSSLLCIIGPSSRVWNIMVATGTRLLCLLGLILYVPVNNFSVMSRWVLLNQY